MTFKPNDKKFWDYVNENKFIFKILSNMHKLPVNTKHQSKEQ